MEKKKTLVGPSYFEVGTAIVKLKNYKLTGSDQMPEEPI
jgi:hypothetical protein